MDWKKRGLFKFDGQYFSMSVDVSRKILDEMDDEQKMEFNHKLCTFANDLLAELKPISMIVKEYEKGTIWESPLPEQIKASSSVDNDKKAK